MNKNFFVLIIMVAIIAGACNGGNKKSNTGNANDNKMTQASTDSLEQEVMDGHNVAMAKYGKLKAMMKESQRLLDSIAALPAKTKQAADPLKTKLTGLLEDLQSAKANMDKWMDEYNMDSAVNNLELRIKYLTEERLKVSKIKEAILNGLQKADSLLKAKL